MSKSGTVARSGSIHIIDPCEYCRRGLTEMLSGYDVSHSDGTSTPIIRYDLILLESTIDSIGSGLRIMGEVRDRLDQPVLFHTNETAHAVMARALALGARGWVQKSEEFDYLHTCIKRAFTDYVWTHKQRRVLSGATKMKENLPFALTPSERRVLLQMTLGMENKEIAEVLGISLTHTQTLVRSMLDKARMTRTQIVVWAIKQGLDEDK